MVWQQYVLLAMSFLNMGVTIAKADSADTTATISTLVGSVVFIALVATI